MIDPGPGLLLDDKASLLITSQPLIVFPFNGNGLEALDCLGNRFELIGFVDDTAQKHGRQSAGYVVSDRTLFDRMQRAQVLAVPGSPTSFYGRRALIESLGVSSGRWAQVIHPGAHVARTAKLGTNVLIMAGVVITSNAVVGDHVCILPNTVVHHDSHIGSWSLVGSNVAVAGGVMVGENCYIGSGSSLKNGISLGNGTLIGMGSTLLEDTPPRSCYAGNPARRLR